MPAQLVDYSRLYIELRRAIKQQFGIDVPEKWEADVLDGRYNPLPPLQMSLESNAPQEFSPTESLGCDMTCCDLFKCPRCSGSSAYGDNFCPDCGAKLNWGTG